MARFATANFGPLEVAEEQMLRMPRGLIGIPSQRWVLLTREPESPFFWLQSLDDPELALPVTRPEIFYPDYQLAVPEETLTGIGLEEGHEAEVLAVVRATAKLEDFTINLRGPLVFDAETRVGGQMATLYEYPVAAPLWAERGINQLDITPPNLPVVQVPREEDA